MADRTKQDRIKDPKNIEDYKLVTKTLKLKIVKMKVTLEKLEQENQHLRAQSTMRLARDKNLMGTSSIPSPPQEQINTETLLGKKQVMLKFLRGAQSFGISPDSVFRIADVEGRGEVEADTFRRVLSKIEFGLSPKQVSNLIYLFDENCNRVITRQQFTDAIYAFQISTESESSHYTQDCLNKVALLIQSSNNNLPKFFEDMSTKLKKNIDLDAFGGYLKSILGDKVYLKQLVAAFNALDLEGNGICDKPNFLYGIQSALHRKQERQGERGESAIYPRSHYESRLSASSNHNAVAGVPDANDSNLKPNTPSQVQGSTVEQLNRKYSVSLDRVYEEVCRIPMGRRFTLYSMTKAVSEAVADKRVPHEQVSRLFKQIDRKQVGSIYFPELINYYLRHGSDMSIILQLLGKYFSHNDLNSEKFFYLFNLGPETDISKSRFLELMSRTFKMDGHESELWGKLWAYFDKGKGVVGVASIIRQMAKFELD